MKNLHNYPALQVKVIILVSVLLLAMSGQAMAEPFSGGTGSESDPYQIETLTDLKNLSNDSNSSYWSDNFKQTADINATETATWNSGAGLDPIGNSTTEFTGSYDGQGYTIDGLTIDRSDESYIGLFGYADTGAEISNIKLTNVDITGHEDVGGLVGENRGTVDNCSSNSTVNGTNNVGGLVGDNKPFGTINNCYSAGSVNGTERVGGLVGKNSFGTIRNSYSTSSVNGTDRVGGLVGKIDDGNIKFSYSTGRVNGTDKVGGLVGRKVGNASSVSSSYWNTETSHQSDSEGGEGLTTAQMKNEGNFTAWSFNGDPWIMGNSRPYLAWEDENPFSGGFGSTNYPYHISDSDDLHSLANNTNNEYWNDHFEQTSDIVLESVDFSPIGNVTKRFTGTYNGQGHTIDGLTIHRGNEDYIGLFGATNSSAEISNIKLTNVDIDGHSSVGGLIGYNANSTVSNCSTSGSVSGSTSVGGLVGKSYGRVDNSTSIGSVNGTNKVGCLVGDNIGTVSNSYSTGSVNGSSSVGGLVGVNNGTIRNSYSTGNVDGSSSVGGLVGNNTDTISASYSNGIVSGDSDCGLVGNNTGTVSNSFWDTDTSDQSSSAGGTGKTTAEMRNIGTFTKNSITGLDSAWDFAGDPYNDTASNDYWGINSDKNSGYPFLMWQGYTAQYPPKVKTLSLAGQGLKSATIQGNIPDLGVPDATEHGICWNTSGQPTISSNKTQKGPVQTTGKFNSCLSGLDEGTTYYVRAYANNTIGTEYGETLDFTFSTATLPGNGTAADPYRIDTATDLRVLSNSTASWDAHFSLQQDIDMSGEEDWRSIGSADDPFNGHFDGNGHVIANCTLDNNATNSGLFGLIGNNGTVSDLGLSRVDVNGTGNVGALAGTNQGTVQNVYVYGEVLGSANATVAGGLVAVNSGNGRISECYATSDVTSEWTAGGLVGKSTSGSIQDSYATGDVTGVNIIGGLVGMADNQAEINRTYYAKGLVCGFEGANPTSGGLVGNGSATVNNSYWDVNASTQYESAGGTRLSTDEMRNSTSYGNWDFGSNKTWNQAEDYNGGYPYLTNSTFYLLQADVNPADKGEVNWAGRYPHGSSAELVIYPDVGYGINEVTGCSGWFLGNVYTIDPVTANCTLNATLDYLRTITNASCDPASIHSDDKQCTDLEDISVDYWISADEIDKGGDCAFIDYSYQGNASVNKNGTANAAAWLGGFTSETLSSDEHTDVTDTELNFNSTAQIVLSREGANATIFEYGPKVLNSTGTSIRVANGTFFTHIGDKVHVEIGSLSTCSAVSPNVGYAFSNASLRMTITPGYTLQYSVQNHGSLTGATTQYVRYENNGTAVRAEPDTGYVFTGWSDGETDNPRQDTDVNASVNATAQFTGDFPGGDGSAGDPYEIINATYLDNVRNMADGDHFVLANDVDVSNLSSWTPLGTDRPFVGTILGPELDTYTISGLNGTALFASIGPGSRIKGIKISGNVRTNATGKAGLLANIVNGTNSNPVTLQGIHVDETCSISGNGTIGGLVGSMSFTELNTVQVDADVNSSSNNVGGIGGIITDSDLGLIYVNGDIRGKDRVGGIGGTMNNGTVQKLIISEPVNANGTHVGGVYGAINNTAPEFIDYQLNATAGQGGSISPWYLWWITGPRRSL